ncbi:MAG: ClpXP protease specificity-enhancing factor [Steroidobacteraceae bacterium]
MASTTEVPKRPYLLRAMHDWISDSKLTPHVIIDAEQAGVEVPRAYVKDGKIILNLSTSAADRLEIRNDGISFNARFAGVPHRVVVPIAAVLGIYARESGEGMVFTGDDLAPQPPPSAPSPDESRRPQLKVVK